VGSHFKFFIGFLKDTASASVYRVTPSFSGVTPLANTKFPIGFFLFTVCDLTTPLLTLLNVSSTFGGVFSLEDGRVFQLPSARQPAPLFCDVFTRPPGGPFSPPIDLKLRMGVFFFYSGLKPFS